MKKYGKATEKLLDSLITFMETHLIHRNFTAVESANMRQVLYTIIHTAQMESGNNFMKSLVQIRNNCNVRTVGNELKNNLNEENKLKTSKLGTMLKGLKAICQSPPF